MDGLDDHPHGLDLRLPDDMALLGPVHAPELHPDHDHDADHMPGPSGMLHAGGGAHGLEQGGLPDDDDDDHDAHHHPAASASSDEGAAVVGACALLPLQVDQVRGRPAAAHGQPPAPPPPLAWARPPQPPTPACVSLGAGCIIAPPAAAPAAGSHVPRAATGGQGGLQVRQGGHDDAGAGGRRAGCRQLERVPFLWGPAGLRATPPPPPAPACLPACLPHGVEAGARSAPRWRAG